MSHMIAEGATISSFDTSGMGAGDLRLEQNETMILLKKIMLSCLNLGVHHLEHFEK